MQFWIWVFALSLFVWFFMAIRPNRYFRYQQIFRASSHGYSVSENMPKISIIIPCRNEEDTLANTLPSVLGQEYHNFEVILVNDQSTDRTAVIAEQILASGRFPGKLHIIHGENLPQGWAGKMWALHQGIQLSDGEWIILTDADLIYSDHTMLTALIQHAKRQSRDMLSLMAKLRTKTFSEKILIPAFLYFFKMLYPFSEIPNPKSKVSAAAGGCILIRRSILESIGGIQAIQNALIDDIALAVTVKSKKYSIELMDSPELLSYRGYDTLGGIWKMVTRSAFTELKYSYLRLFGCTLGLGLLFFLPILALFSYLWMPFNPSLHYIAEQYPDVLSDYVRHISLADITTAIGMLTYFLIIWTYLPTIRYYKLPLGYACTLPLAGLLYLAMTWDSARRYAFGIRAKWKERSYKA